MLIKFLRKVAVFTLVFVAVAALGCGRRNRYVPPPPPKVTVVQPWQQDATSYAEYTGRADAVESVEIRARVKGFLEGVHFKDGDNVHKGDLLFTIEPYTYFERLNQAKAEVASRKSQYATARIEYLRIQRLFTMKAAAESDLNKAKAVADSAKAALDSAESLVKETKIQFGYTRIEAPISGRIGEKMVDEGNLVGDTKSTLLTTIVKLDPIYVYFSISQNDLLRYMETNRKEKGMANERGVMSRPALAGMVVGYMSSGLGSGTLLTLAAAGYGEAPRVVYMGLKNQTDYPIEGTIDYVDNKLDPGTGTFLVRAIFPNANRLVLPNMSVRIRVPTGAQKNALLVPERALGADQAGRYLLVVGKDDTVERRTVQVGTKIGGLVVIEEGLRPGEWIVSSGVQRARPGAIVNPQKTSLKNSTTSKR